MSPVTILVLKCGASAETLRTENRQMFFQQQNFRGGNASGSISSADAKKFGSRIKLASMQTSTITEPSSIELLLKPPLGVPE
jgi:hypothetical protein